MLPHASLDVTEVLSSRKYPLYAQYQQTVSRFVPLPPTPVGVPPPLALSDKALIGWFVLGTLITYLIDMEQVRVSRAHLARISRASHTYLMRISYVSFLRATHPFTHLVSHSSHLLSI